ncbi:UDP-N-acetylmuramate dehydrogenase [Sandaracinus amylolyticus]|uniref:UDP-N-acetylenolpyruvoylglucosamine reductase n=1 Tax=Sandaracinus amylolyticus TaxID=927083 RepID=A0A0F6W1N7_9BACT|nr:UDP-N-acetylmuramate dehydrogenase [Sandaracinus amylolyticus]AKF04977.1 UDP-N-acetylenolpyruvoylglucosamine reductase [Sandaracinus amylolyticus]
MRRVIDEQLGVDWLDVNADHDVPLAPHTTLELGGPAARFASVTDVDSLVHLLALAEEREVPVAILGGGSNLVVSDAGFDGLVIAMRMRGVTTTRQDDVVLVEAAAGEPWDELVDRATSAGLAGLECLSGIPGLVGATPIQNVGAYGQEVADTIASVRVFDRVEKRVVELTPAQCEFAYRDSMFKRDPDRYVVLSVVFALVPDGPATVCYAELERALEGSPRDVRTVRETVIALRRAKSMVVDPADPNHRSAGSFFTNPIVDASLADALSAQHESMPRWPQPDGRVKLAAGWLIERAGITKGMRRGNVGISTKHALALVHHGGGTTAELLALASEVQDAVRARFGVELHREPVLWR